MTEEKSADKAGTDDAGVDDSNDNKTRPTDVDPREYVGTVEPPRRRADAETLLELMHEVTGQDPVMWGPSIVGYGSYRYRYATGRLGEWPAAGFSARKTASTVYLMEGFGEANRDLLDRLGPHTTGKSCLYLKNLDQVDLDVLRELVQRSYSAVADD